MYKVLIVEDEEILRNSIRNSILSYNLGFSTINVATNGANALQMLSNNLPDIILSDIPHAEYERFRFGRACKGIFSKYSFRSFQCV